jgi:ribonuclease VapC
LIVVDTSAIIEIAILGRRATDCAAALDEAHSVAISAGTLSEAFIVALGKGGRKLRLTVEELLSDFQPQVIDVDAMTARKVADVYARYGKGSDINCLNWGDCYAYAVANDLHVPLLFIGKDFGKTDVESVLLNPDPAAQ